MLAVVTLVAGLFGGPRPTAPAIVPCPSGPVETIATTLSVCSALEVSGRTADGGAVLDPAFDVSVPPTQLARPIESATILSAYTNDGRRLFSLPIAANGAFHLYVPLAPAALQSVSRIVLSTPAGNAERDATPAADPAAELISIDDRHVIVAWDAAAFPAIRITETPAGRPLADVSGASTYEQASVETRARIVYLTFSNGVRSIARAFTIFGR